jgi:hypothetical protein
MLLAPLALLAGASIVHAQLPSCTTAIADATTLIKQAKTTNATDAAARANQLQAIHQALSNIDLIAACGTQATIAKDIEAKRQRRRPRPGPAAL